MPIDPESGGTWIGMNSAGLVVCLLNATLPPGAAERDLPACVLSRGEIVPSLLNADDLESAVLAAMALNPTSYPPFRLLIAEVGRCVVLASDTSRLGVQLHAWGRRPLMLTSSGLGDHVVEMPRRDAFHEFFDESGDWFLAQDRFHEHTWPGQTHLGVLMSRSDARTVSRTVIEMSDHAATLTYSHLDESTLRPKLSSRVALTLAGVEAPL